MEFTHDSAGHIPLIKSSQNLHCPALNFGELSWNLPTRLPGTQTPKSKHGTSYRQQRDQGSTEWAFAHGPQMGVPQAGCPCHGHPGAGSCWWELLFGVIFLEDINPLTALTGVCSEVRSEQNNLKWKLSFQDPVILMEKDRVLTYSQNVCSPLPGLLLLGCFLSPKSRRRRMAPNMSLLTQPSIPRSDVEGRSWEGRLRKQMARLDLRMINWDVPWS